MADPLPVSRSRLIQHGRGERIKVRGGWLSFLAVGEQTGGAYGCNGTPVDGSLAVSIKPFTSGKMKPGLFLANTHLKLAVRHSVQVRAAMSLDHDMCPIAMPTGRKRWPEP